MAKQHKRFRFVEALSREGAGLAYQDDVSASMSKNAARKKPGTCMTRLCICMQVEITYWRTSAERDHIQAGNWRNGGVGRKVD